MDRVPDSDDYDRRLQAALRASSAGSQRASERREQTTAAAITRRSLVSLPFKALRCGTIDVPAAAADAPPRHAALLRQAAAILSGTHPAWRAVLAKAGGPIAAGRASTLSQRELRDLVAWGAAAPLPRGARALVSPLFKTPKSDGVHARPILDARQQNRLFDWAAVARRRFRLLSPLQHVRVGVGVGVRGRYALYEADATSYFPSFRWHATLAAAHAFRVGGARYAHAVPAHGCTVMPLVAQSVSAFLADGPPADAPARAFVASRLSIVYE